MALSLEDLMAAPSDPDALNKHLQGLGLLQPPPEIQSSIPPATVAPMTPGGPSPTVATMTPPIGTEVAKTTPVAGLKKDLILSATGQPNIPAHKLEDLQAPEIGGTGPDTSGALKVAPMAPLPNLTHTEKMALPQTSAGVPNIGSAAYTENELQRAQEKKDNPWGTAENHPGLLGKIGHVAGKIGNIALDAVAPGIAMNIPGTDLNTLGQTNQLKRELAQRTAAEGLQRNQASEEAARDVTTAEGRQRLLKEQNEQNLERDTEGNVTGWKDAQGKLHGLDEEGTPQAVKDIAEATQNKPHFEKTENGDIVQITPGKNGAHATSDVVYKGNPKMKTEIRGIVNPKDGHTYDQVIDVTPGSPTFGTSLAQIGRSREDKQESPTAALTKEKAGEEPVIGYDKNGTMRIMSRSQAKDEGLSHVIKASAKDREDAENSSSALNELGVKTRNLAGNLKALDQNIFQRAIIAQVLAHPSNTAIDSLIRETALKGGSEDTKNFATDVLNLREAALNLPKLMTGGSRVSEVQAQALWQTIADGSSADSKYALKQLKKFDQMTDRLWKKVPQVEGNAPERAFGEAGPGGDKGGATATPGGPPREARPGFKWQQNKKTGEYREAPVS